MGVTREPEVGEILLFCVDNIEGRQRCRPFLVCSIVDGAISGEVFADFERDTKTAWALRLFYRLDKDTRTQWVSGVLEGEGVGTWRFRELRDALAPQLPKPKPIAAPPQFKSARPILPLAQVKGPTR